MSGGESEWWGEGGSSWEDDRDLSLKPYLVREKTDKGREREAL